MARAIEADKRYLDSFRLERREPLFYAVATLILCLLLTIPALAGTGGRINAGALHGE